MYRRNRPKAVARLGTLNGKIAADSGHLDRHGELTILNGSEQVAIFNIAAALSCDNSS
jgi:hypothetical protein